jgi:twitching motility protein PilT
MIDLHELLKEAVKLNASDLHLTVGRPPMLRVNGLMKAIDGLPVLTPQSCFELCYCVLNEDQRTTFEQEQEIDFSIGVKDLSRFRVNLFVQRGNIAGVFRTIPNRIKTLEDLALPPVVADLARRGQGLVLVTGPTGSGKSTTLAAMLDLINQEKYNHIVTLEDPIEYFHEHKKSLVNQREIGNDTHSFQKALRSVLRQDPDVVLIGEMRDVETIEAALHISETGHLCLATLHTQSAMQSITRIIDMFPPHQRDQIRTQLSFSLQGIVSQRLIPKADGKGRVLACEILVLNQAIRHQIRDDKLHQIQGQIQLGQGKSGMMTMNQSLYKLYQNKQILLEDARANSNDLDEFTSMLQNQSTAPTQNKINSLNTPVGFR